MKKQTTEVEEVSVIEIKNKCGKKINKLVDPVKNLILKNQI